MRGSEYRNYRVPQGIGGWVAPLLIFLTIPIYNWIARALDGDWARGDIDIPGVRTVGHGAQDASAVGANLSEVKTDVVQSGVSADGLKCNADAVRGDDAR